MESGIIWHRNYSTTIRGQMRTILSVNSKQFHKLIPCPYPLQKNNLLYLTQKSFKQEN